MNEYHLQKMNDRLAEFKKLWKSDDPKWRAQRNSDWRLISRNCYQRETPAHKKELKKYFVEGEIVTVIGELSMYLLTPVTSASCARRFILSDNFLTPFSKKRVVASFFQKQSFTVVYWYKDHARYLANGVLGQEYKELRTTFATGEIESFTPDPTSFCYMFLIHMEGLFSGKYIYSGHTECLDYFISALSHVDKGYQEFEERYFNLFELAESATDNESVSEAGSCIATSILKRKTEIEASWRKIQKDRRLD